MSKIKRIHNFIRMYNQLNGKDPADTMFFPENIQNTAFASTPSAMAVGHQPISTAPAAIPAGQSAIKNDEPAKIVEQTPVEKPHISSVHRKKHKKKRRKHESCSEESSSEESSCEEDG